jgi:hypothetical protein
MKAVSLIGLLIQRNLNYYLLCTQYSPFFYDFLSFQLFPWISGCVIRSMYYLLDYDIEYNNNIITTEYDY